MTGNDQTLTLWRHPDPATAAIPGVQMGTTTPGHPTSRFAHDLYNQGVRRVTLDQVVDASGNASRAAALVADLALVRDLTARGIIIEWRIRLNPTASEWRLLNHLFPPTAILGPEDAPEISRKWTDSFYLCKCVHRHGPGFVQVRDRRTGELHRLTLDEPEYLAAMEQLLDRVDETAVPETVLEDFSAENLVWRSGRFAVWLPYHVQRWPWPSMLV
ncbi:hypothetical protein ABH926_005081 [Catenulispora sp. GP43]|uniref:DUF5825 family protein n=1 Tax=Catenulispora sp. GP43 TaxID=3156263 RepID=UPI003518E22E